MEGQLTSGQRNDKAFEEESAKGRDLASNSTYASEPSGSTPFAPGVLSEQSVQDAINALNLGHVDGFGATYVFDHADPSYVTDVAWPARVMPTNFIDTQAQWSLSTVTQNLGTADSITVHVERRRDHKVWDLSSSDVTVNEVTEYGSFIGYDKNGCIVWSMPDVGLSLDGDVYGVTVTGTPLRRTTRWSSLTCFPLQGERL